jgi:hypothetical protein
VCVVLVIQHAKRVRRVMLLNPYMWPGWLYHIFPSYLINGMILRKKVTEHKMGFDFLYNLCLKHILRRIQNISKHSKHLILRRISVKYEHKCTYVFTQSTRHSYHVLMKIEFSLQIF